MNKRKHLKTLAAAAAVNSTFLSCPPKFTILILLCEFWELIINYYYYHKWYRKFSDSFSIYHRQNE